jgi:hypothetical protein
MADVFISYKSERRRAARHLEQILILNGYTVWIDHALVRGHDYEEQIQREIAAAKAVIVLWCSLSVASSPVRSEANYAKEKKKQIPIKIESCEVPLFSSMTQFIDLSAWSGAPRDALFDAVLDDVEKHVGRKPVYDRDLLRAFESTWRDNGSFSLANFPRETVAVPQTSLHLGGATETQPQRQSETLLTIAAREWPLVRDSRDAARLLRFEQHFAGTYYAGEAHELRAAVEADLREKEELKRRIFTEAEAKKRKQEDVAASYKADGRIQIDAKHIHGAPDGWFKPGNGKTEWFKDFEHGPEMVAVPAKQPFAIGRFTLTFDEWDAAQAHPEWQSPSGIGPRQANDYGWGRGRQPAIDVSWEDAKAYCKWLSKVTSKTYRLPSEAEWEQCCRAGTTTEFWWSNEISTSQANYNGNYTFGNGKKGEYRERTVTVDSFEANPWGLYQVHGNVWEWCEDAYDASSRVLRGGSWGINPTLLRSAYRGRNRPDDRDFGVGFRLARTL